MTIGSANKPGRLVSTSVLWTTGFFFVASALYGAHAEQRNPAKAATFGYVANVDGDTVSVIDTAAMPWWPRFRCGDFLTEWPPHRTEPAPM
jgi:hypothetical protein